MTDYSRVRDAEARAYQDARFCGEIRNMVFTISFAQYLCEYAINGDFPCLVRYVELYISNWNYMSIDSKDFKSMLPYITKAANRGIISSELYSKFQKMYTEHISISKINRKKSLIKWVILFLAVSEAFGLFFSLTIGINSTITAIIVMLSLIYWARYCYSEYKRETDYNPHI